jgi:HSP20 family protein
MKNKIMIGAIILLAGALILENVYLFGRYSKEMDRRNFYGRHQPVVINKLPQNKTPIFYEMTSRDPFAEMNIIQKKMDRLLREDFSGKTNPPDFAGNRDFAGSNINFSNTGSAYILKIAMPGVDKNAIEIRVEGRQLVISSQDKKEKINQDEESYSRKSAYGDFLSHFILPEDAQINLIASDFKNGILTVIIPRQENHRKDAKGIIKVPVK